MNDNLEQLVLDWGYNKGIFQHSDSKTQCLKFLSEAGEVADAVAVNNLPLIEDGIGDVLVTLILLAEMNHLDLERTPKYSKDVMPTLRAEQGGEGRCVATPTQVRRLTPTECERLQGFPDGWTNVPHRGKPAADAPRYKSLGNSMAVPVIRWIGERIEAAIQSSNPTMSSTDSR